MFTGIIEAIGQVERAVKVGTNTDFLIRSSISNQLKPDQSVSHNGVCLTVTKVEGDCHWVTAIDETLRISTFRNILPEDNINLERCMLNNGRFDGHIVQGHVDQTAEVVAIKNEGGSWLFDFQYDPLSGNVTVEKGSIAINGVSLTCFNSRKNGFTAAIIPYTFEHTNFNQLQEGTMVNLEFDIIGKYVKRLLGS